jgi:hypothetical protein
MQFSGSFGRLDGRRLRPECIGPSPRAFGETGRFGQVSEDRRQAALL